MSTVTQPSAVPAHTREIAARLSALFERDVEIVKQLNDAHQRLTHANERLRSGLAPDPFGDPGDGGPTANSTMRQAVQHAGWTIHRAFCRYQHACEERRQLAVDVGELSQQLTDTLRAAGWSTQDARQANVHKLAAG